VVGVPPLVQQKWTLVAFALLFALETYLFVR